MSDKRLDDLVNDAFSVGASAMRLEIARALKARGEMSLANFVLQLDLVQVDFSKPLDVQAVP